MSQSAIFSSWSAQESILASLVGDRVEEVVSVFSSILRSFLVAMHEEGALDNVNSIDWPLHLNRIAIVYIRQSTIAQVRFHKESTERQYALREKALNLGWSENLVQVIDEDLGISGAHKSNRQGFQRLVG